MSEAAMMDDGLPLVGEDYGNRGLWLGLGGIAIAGLLLFVILESNRQTAAQPDIPSPRDYAAATTPQPGLAIPAIGALGLDIENENPAIATNRALPNTPSRLPPVRLIATPAPSNVPRAPAAIGEPTYVPSATPPAPIAPDPGRSAPIIVYDAVAAVVAAVGEPSLKATRATPAIAAAPVDRHNLVAQGTLIYAVLETALNSTQAGQARAIISTDVYNAAGTKVLIPKGSRVFGEYKADISSGQNRAQIVWGRLIRPDGATISLDSPASDQLGRAGVKGKVDTHFGERLINALLQSTIDFGGAVAARAVTSSNGVVVALPNATQGAASQIITDAPKPTLKVRHGTRIAVFVSRDLDFSAVE
jgi:type IV secretion system protein VirB10